MKQKKTRHAEGRKHTTITIPKPLYEILEERIKSTGFASVSSYVTYLLRRLVSSDASGKNPREKDERRLKERLKTLGYI